MKNDEVIKEIKNIARFNYTLAPIEVFEKAIEALKEQRPRGEWIESKRGLPTNHHYCSNCNEAIRKLDYQNFCPNCGSDNRPKDKEG